MATDKQRGLMSDLLARVGVPQDYTGTADEFTAQFDALPDRQASAWLERMIELDNAAKEQQTDVPF